MQRSTKYCCQCDYMKKLLFILTIVITLTSCNKESIQKQVAGKWEFVVFVGYGVFDPPLPPGNGKIIEFGNGRNFKRYAHDTLLFNGSYSISRKKDCYSDQFKSFLKTSDASFANERVVIIKGDSLMLSTSACLIDGGVAIYRKID